MLERVEAVAIGVLLEPNAPEAVLAVDDYGHAALAVEPHPDDADRRTVVLLWSGCAAAEKWGRQTTRHGIYIGCTTEDSVVRSDLVRSSEVADSPRSPRWSPGRH